MDFVEFPHSCKVFDSITDETLPPSLRVREEKIIVETICDIQAAGKPTDSSYVIDADYIVYIPVIRMPKIQKGAKIELRYNDTDTRTGIVRQYEPSMMLGNRIWVKEIDN
jgi:hypothetical protein